MLVGHCGWIFWWWRNFRLRRQTLESNKIVSGICRFEMKEPQPLPPVKYQQEMKQIYSRQVSRRHLLSGRRLEHPTSKAEMPTVVIGPPLPMSTTLNSNVEIVELHQHVKTTPFWQHERMPTASFSSSTDWSFRPRSQMSAAVSSELVHN